MDNKDNIDEYDYLDEIELKDNIDYEEIEELTTDEEENIRYVTDEEEIDSKNKIRKVVDKKKVIILSLISVLLVLIIALFFVIKNANKKVIVSFDTDGGSKINSMKIKKNNIIDKPDDPIKDGYIFIGWYLDGERYNFNSHVTSNIELEAKWIKGEEDEKFSVEPNKVTLKPKEKLTLRPNSNDELTWNSDNEEVAIVDNKGEVTAIKEGNALITAINNNGSKAIIEVSVVLDNENIQSIKLPENVVVGVGSTYKMVPEVLPTTAIMTSFIWKSSSDDIAKIDSNGNIKGIKPGKVYIMFSTIDGKFNEKVVVTVKDFTITKINITTLKDTITEGDKLNIKTTVLPANADKSTVLYKSSDENVATVSDKGIITAIGKGITTITAYTSDGKVTSSINIKVLEIVKPTGISITSNKGDTLEVNDSALLTAEVQPLTASNKKVKWTTSNKSIVSVVDNDNGTATIKALKEGKVFITATSLADNSISTPYSITVNAATPLPVPTMSVVKNVSGNYDVTVTGNYDAEAWKSIICGSATINSSITPYVLPSTYVEGTQCTIVYKINGKDVPIKVIPN